MNSLSSFWTDLSRQTINMFDYWKYFLQICQSLSISLSFVSPSHREPCLHPYYFISVYYLNATTLLTAYKVMSQRCSSALLVNIKNQHIYNSKFNQNYKLFLLDLFQT